MIMYYENGFKNIENVFTLLENVFKSSEIRNTHKYVSTGGPSDGDLTKKGDL